MPPYNPIVIFHLLALGSSYKHPKKQKGRMKSTVGASLSPHKYSIQSAVRDTLESIFLQLKQSINMHRPDFYFHPN